MYNPNRMKYKLSTDLGKVVECKICEFKRVTSSDYVKYNFETNKFEIAPKLKLLEAFCKVILGIKKINPGFIAWVLILTIVLLIVN